MAVNDALELKARKYAQGNEDARDGYPMNRFMKDDPDYKSGYEEFRSFMSEVIKNGITLRSKP
jgi:hypothetical protein